MRIATSLRDRSFQPRNPARTPSMPTIDPGRSPFFSVPFLNRLQKMIPTGRGPASRAEQEIEGALQRIPEELHYIRKLWATDQVPFCNHLLRLDLDGRHDRFAMGVSDDFIRNYAELCFTMRGWIFGYFSDDDLRGAGELRLIGDRGTAAEAAFSVESGWRRRGVGRELMGRIVQAASNARVTTLYMSCLASNRAMQKLARHFEADIKFEADQVTGRMVGRPPTIASQWEERVEDAASLATSLVELHRRREEATVAPRS
jgi:GNAT superfamily N-acetyltransferase